MDNLPADRGAIVLAGGRSSRMGTAKAWLDWHGATLVSRVTGIVGRAVAPGPVVVVAAPGQELPELAPGIEVVTDAREGRGPMMGLAAGLQALEGRAEIAYASSTDVPLLHPAFVARVLNALTGEHDAVLPEVGAHRQPLAAAYRTSLRGLVDRLIEDGMMRPGFLFEHCRTLQLDERALLADGALARHDPQLASVANLNERQDYEQALTLPAPDIGVRLFGTLATRHGGAARQTVRAWSLGELAAALDLALDEHVVAALNGDQITRDPRLPLVAGDAVSFMVADAGG
ncbi:MAG: molybdenum cofactor guanylyltransferase [Solirubrobacteraceae bacterium]